MQKELLLFKDNLRMHVYLMGHVDQCYKAIEEELREMEI